MSPVRQNAEHPELVTTDEAASNWPKIGDRIGHLVRDERFLLPQRREVTAGDDPSPVPPRKAAPK